MRLYTSVLVFVIITICQVTGYYVQPEQVASVNEPLLRSKRLTIKNERGLWTKGIVPYVFDDTLPKERQQEYLEKVFPVYEKYSCIRFVEWTDTTAIEYGLDHNNYLIFEQKSPQCESNLGNTRRNGQRLTCCYWRACLHEVAHALGFYHEHQSPIRNEFVRINFENIKDGLGSAFSMENGNDHGVYDFESIMHYGLKAWSTNSEPTITLLEAEFKNVSQFADSERYFYLFMEVNELYQCTAGCDGACANGGYMAWMGDRCACRCPEGLSGKSSCMDLEYNDYQCGGIIDLDDQQTNIDIRSPIITENQTPVTCHWFVRSPDRSRMILDFPQFKVRKQNGECVDEVAVRHYLPGMSGIPYCGNVFKQTIQADRNMLAFSFTQTPSSSGVSSFVAKVTFKHEDDYCYSLENKGHNYNGNVSQAQDSSVCLPWYEVLHCEHNLFRFEDADKNLKNNFCRNPDEAKGPWCYTQSDGCLRTYCDACNFGVCKDLTGKCSTRIEIDSSYCQSDPDAFRVCRRSCGQCDDHTPLPSVSTTFCSAPNLPADAQPQSFQDKYSVGENVTIYCASAPDHQVITCLSDGQWTPLKYVCGTCMPGWTRFKGNCYKLFDQSMRRENAEEFCNLQYPGSSLATINFTEKHDFVTTLMGKRNGCTPVWIGLRRDPDGTTYSWDDGSELNWTNWADENTPGGLGCVAINMKCVWADKSCGERLQFVCQYRRPDKIICEDQIDNCLRLSNSVADFCESHRSTFASSYCAKTCNFC